MSEQEKHDGKLSGGDTYEVYYYEAQDKAGAYSYVCIQGTHNLSDDEVVLEPKQALSLLAWLRQEEAKLLALAKEEEAKLLALAKEQEAISAQRQSRLP